MSEQRTNGGRPAGSGGLPLARRIAELVRAHRLGLARVAASEGASGDEAFDCVQDAFCALLAMPGADELGEHDAARLLSAIVRNLARNHRRRHAVSRVHERDDEALLALQSPEPGAEALIGEAESRAKLVACIGKLRTLQGAVVTLRLLEERPGESVAVELGLTPKHVAVLLHRARQQLRRCVTDDEIEADDEADEEGGA